ncbi:MAG TPA: XdhC/CoxI family protein [Candidatus Acidoferrales bacterium]|nr:XdhC/CoxI family protein [Candidatus Acidoferrales bacterium]
MSREIFTTVAERLEAGEPVALAILVATDNASPSPPGTTVAVDGSGRIAGSIGAGCHERDVVEAARATIADGAFRRLRIDLSDGDEILGGAACGGALEIAVWKPERGFAAQAREIVRGAQAHTVVLEDGSRVTYPGKKRLVVVGATLLAREVARLAKALDFFVTAIDPRPAFATRERLPDADEIALEWPDDVLPRELDRSDAIVILSHDPKFDVPALACALQSAVAYVGLLGSRRSQAARRQALRERGIGEASLARIHGPVGLDLGGETPAETALSILAQIVAEAHGRSGGALDRTNGNIHATA